MSELAEKAFVPIIGDTFTIKSVKTDTGHEGAGAMGNVYMNGKKAFAFYDDGTHGEVEITFASKNMENAVKAFAKEHQLAQVMLDNGWDFYDDISKISEHQTIVMIGEALIYNHVLQKELKKIQRKTKNKLIVGTNSRYRQIGFRNTKDLRDLLEYSNGPELLQSAYDDLKKELREGERFFNTDEQLDALGIKR